MMQLAQAGVGVASVSWLPPGKADEHGTPDMFDPLLRTILDAAHAKGLSVSLHLEPYEK